MAALRRGLSPSRAVVFAFAAAVLVGTALLMLPVASDSGQTTNLSEALFTSTSAVCVTGLTVVDTVTHWSTFGEIVIMVLIQIGGFGIMTLSSLIAVVLSNRLGLRQRLQAQTETSTIDAGDVRRVLKGVAVVTVVAESVIAVVLTWRFAIDDGVSFGRAVYLGIFHSISAFNNAGFALFSDNLIGFAADWWLLGAVGVAVIAGGLGMPVWFDLRQAWRRPRQWSIHSKLTIGGTVVLIVVGTVLITAAEWTNAGTLGGLPTPERFLNGWFQAVMPRTAGFNSVDLGLARESTWMFTDALMLVGGGSASTAGGIKVSTFALLAFVIWSEVRGEPDVNVFDRRVPSVAQRQAMSLVLLAIGAVFTGAVALVMLANVRVGPALFEALSAFSTVGLSTGITPGLGTPAQMVLVTLMFLGRVGPITLFAALVLRERGRLFRYPFERPIIG